jgi:hypothetical protein
MTKINFEKELRGLWKKIRTKNAPHPNMAEDIEEFLDQQEWGLALEHILDWAAAEKKSKLIDARAKELKKLMAGD